MSDEAIDPQDAAPVADSVTPPAGEGAGESPPDESLAELESLIEQLKGVVGSLRDGDLDAAALEPRLRELNELADRAATALDAATR